MKYLYLILFLFLSSQTSSAQKIRFTDTSNVWRVQFMNFQTYPNWANHSPWTYTTDTIIENLEYRLLNYQCWVREDTVAAIVYYRYVINQFSIDTIDRILYNYNLVSGDTIRTSYDSTATHVVSNVDSTLINNTWHKVWHFIPVNGSFSPTEYDVIGGIGCLHNPIFPIAPHHFEQAKRVICFSNNNSTPLVSPAVGLYNFDNDNSCLLNVRSENYLPLQILVSPNPMTETSKTNFRRNIHSGQLIVYNSIGQKVIDVPVRNVNTYTIGDKISVRGMYYFLLTDNSDGMHYSGKFSY